MLKTSEKVTKTLPFDTNQHSSFRTCSHLGCQGDVFDYPRYVTSVKLFPNDELCIRFQPRVKGGSDNQEQINNKIRVKELENKSEKTYPRCLLEAKEDTKRVENPVKRGWGILPSPKKFTKKVSKRVCRALSAMDKKFPRETLRFLTLTLPGSTEESMKTIASYSAYIVNRVSTWLSDIIGEYAKYKVAVWELQKRRALHLHLVINHPEEEVLNKVDSRFKNFCYKLFQQISNRSGVDLFGKSDGTTWKDNPSILRCNSEPVKKSVAKYMAKYLTKTACNYQLQSTSKKEIYYPSRWAYYGSKVSSLIEEKTTRIEGKAMTAEDAEFLLTKVCLRNSEAWCVKGYEPLLYQDKVGGGINFKMFISPEKQEEAIRKIKFWVDYIWEERMLESETKLPDLECVVEKELKANYLWIYRQEIIDKYGKNDDRLWQKQFRNNPVTVPGFEEFFVK